MSGLRPPPPALPFLLALAALGLLLGGCAPGGGGGGADDLGNPQQDGGGPAPPQLTLLEIEAPSAPITAGETVALAATATYDDGSAADVTGAVSWLSSDPSVASVGAGGILSALAPGSATLRAELDGVRSAPVEVTVVASPPLLVALTLESSASELFVGESATLTVTAHYDDGTSEDVSTAVAWAVADPTVAAVTPLSPPIATGLAAGSTAIEASYLGLTSNALMLTVLPLDLVSLDLSAGALLLAPGETAPLAVIAEYSNGSTADVTAQVAWQIGDVAVIGVVPGSPAELIALAEGTSTLAAGLGGVSSNVLTIEVVSQPTIPVALMNAAGPELVVGGEVFGADAAYDGIHPGFTGGTFFQQVIPIAGTDDDALYQTLRYGSMGFRAPVPNGAYLVELHYAEISPGYAPGERVFDVLIEGAVVDPDLDVAAEAGFATALAHTHTVLVEDGLLEIDWQPSIDFAVVCGVAARYIGGSLPPSELVGITVAPAQATVLVGASLAFTATGSYANGTTSDVTAAVDWSSSSTAVATVSNDPGSEGVATGVAPGAVIITAADQNTGISGSAALEVQDLGSAPQVPLYGIFQLSVSNANSYSNPFDYAEIELRATFTSPTSRLVEVSGYYDGDGQGAQQGSIWVLRFMPDELGAWSYSYWWTGTGPHPAAGSGNLEAVPSANRGPLIQDPDRPYSVMHKNGERFFWSGDTEWFFLSDDFTDAERNAAIDFLAAHSVNNFLMTMVNDDTNDVFPWVTPTDHWHFDLAKLRRWEAVIERLGDNGIIADLWFYSDLSWAFYPGPDTPEEDLYFKYMIARLAAYQNVTWNLGLEYNEYRSDAWVVGQAQQVKDLDPYDHLLSVHRTDTAWPFAGDANLDHTALQSLGAAHGTLNATIIARRQETAAAGRPIPIFHAEFFIEGSAGNLTQFRKGMWAIVTAGGCFKSGSLGYWIGTYYTNGQHFDVQDRVHDYVVTIPYWRMEPMNSLVVAGSAYALADPGDEVLLYLPNGGTVSVDLSAAAGVLPVEWYDPRNGLLTAAAPVAGGQVVTFSAPDANDWVLHIGDGL